MAMVPGTRKVRQNLKIDEFDFNARLALYARAFSGRGLAAGRVPICQTALSESSSG